MKGSTWSSSGGGGSSVQLDWELSRSDMCVSLSLWYVAWLVIQDTPSISSFFWFPSKSKNVDHIKKSNAINRSFWSVHTLLAQLEKHLEVIICVIKVANSF